MDSKNCQAYSLRPQMVEVFGFPVPTSDYYLHRGHTWVLVEDTGQVRVGLDGFSQKILGPADELKLPEIGKVYFQDHVCMALVREGHKASVEAPVDGAIQEINPKVRQRPGLIHDDPYGEGWLFTVKPTNLQQNLDNLFYGESNATWIEQESQRLLYIMNTAVGATLPSGGALLNDVYGHYPQLGWRRLVKEFLLTNLTKDWKKR
ncbi:MAG: glycine cleavage system protein H [Desulfobaccales bacterium]